MRIGHSPRGLYLLLLLSTTAVVIMNVKALLLVPATTGGRGCHQLGNAAAAAARTTGCGSSPPMWHQQQHRRWQAAGLCWSQRTQSSWSILRGGSSSSSSISSTAIDELSTSETKAYQLLQDLHDAKFPFRLVVIGNGAILEATTPELGPIFKITKSPKTGETLTTFASADQSFEFHLKIGQVKRIVLTSRPTTTNTAAPNGEQPSMQLFRFLTADGSPMCSLILADKSEAAQIWFQTMVDKYDGGDLHL
jgi:hypothetical protein